MVALILNGAETEVSADPQMPLLWAIRDIAGLSGTKYGCGVGLCGACTVHVDGTAERSCQITLGEVAGKDITTIEGLDPAGDHRVQVAWRELSVPQCGFCQAGQIMQAASIPGRDAQTHRRGNPRSHGRQRLPLRLLSAHRRGRAPRSTGI